jgi:hypothetical protein
MVFISENIPSPCVASLHHLGYETVPLPSDPRLAPQISSHPDMLLFLSDHTLISDRFYYEVCAKKQIDRACKERNLTLCLTDESPTPEYPHDIRFNAFVLDKYLFCYQAYTSPAVLKTAEKKGKKIISIRQGYARCSTCPVGTHALITADPSILQAAQKQNDLDALSVHQGHIELPGYPHGFLGGCCGADEDRLFFCGSLSHHPDGDMIHQFCRNHNIQIVELSTEPLFDCGSLIFIPDN